MLSSIKFSDELHVMVACHVDRNLAFFVCPNCRHPAQVHMQTALVTKCLKRNSVQILCFSDFFVESVSVLEKYDIGWNPMSCLFAK